MTDIIRGWDQEFAQRLIRSGHARLLTRMLRSADILAATSLPNERFQQWLKMPALQTLLTEQVGERKRRSFHLLDAYFVRLLAALTDGCGVPISAAIEIVTSAAYGGTEARAGARDLELRDAKYWHPALIDRDRDDPWFLVSLRTESSSWSASFVSGSTALRELKQAIPSDHEAALWDRGHRVNVTLELDAVDRELFVRDSADLLAADPECKSFYHRIARTEE